MRSILEYVVIVVFWGLMGILFYFTVLSKQSGVWTHPETGVGCLLYDTECQIVRELYMLRSDNPISFE